LEDKLKKNSDDIEKMENIIREFQQIIHKKEEDILIYKNKVAELENNLILKENKINFFIEKYSNKKVEEKYYDYNDDNNRLNDNNYNSILNTDDNINDLNFNQKNIYENILLERSKEIEDLIKSNTLLTKEKEDLEAKIINMKSLVSEISQRMEIEAEKQKNMNEEISDMLERY
jgi:hypothetical protein